MDKTSKNNTTINILHFNDVYELDMLNHFVYNFKKHDKGHLKLFSGDIFSPSIASNFFKGQQFIKPLNQLNVDVACVGNHDLDFGTDHLKTLTKQLKFPWLLSNLKFKGGGIISGTKDFHVIEHNGIKVGFIGLAAREWIDTLDSLTLDDIDIEDPNTCAERLCSMMKKEHNVEFIISQNHMRTSDEITLLNSNKNIDICLGGHDHVYSTLVKNGCIAQKSGTDFYTFSEICIDFDMGDDTEVTTKDSFISQNDWKDLDFKEYICYRNNRKFICKVKKVSVSKTDPEDAECKESIRHYQQKIEQLFKDPVLKIQQDYDTRFNVIRTEETPFLNFQSKFIGNWSQYDICLIQSGHLRCDKLFDRNTVLSKKDVYQMLPICDCIIGTEVTGEDLIGALNRGCGRIPNQDGGFPNFNSIRAIFDSSKAASERLVKDSVTFYGDPIQPTKIYKICGTSFQLKGGDGYDTFKDKKILLDSENSFNCYTILSKFLLLPMDENYRIEFELFKKNEDIFDEKFLRETQKFARNSGEEFLTSKHVENKKLIKLLKKTSISRLLNYRLFDKIIKNDDFYIFELNYSHIGNWVDRNRNILNEGKDSGRVL